MRRSGRTTRMVDAAVQSFFNNGYALIDDHNGTINANRFALDAFVTRMAIEHNVTDIPVYIVWRDEFDSSFLLATRKEGGLELFLLKMPSFSGKRITRF